MFRMEFQSSLDAVEEDEEPSGTSRNDEGRGNSVNEQDEHNRAAENIDNPPKSFGGRVGKYGLMQRVVNSNHAVLQTVTDLSPVMNRRMSSNNSIPKNWVEPDLIDFASPKPVASETLAPADEVVTRELVKPFAEISVKTTEVKSVQNQPAIRHLLSDGVEVPEAVSQYSPGTSSWQPTWTSSMRSTNSSTTFSDSSDAQSSSLRDSTGEKVKSKDEEKVGSRAAKAYNRAFNEILYKKSKPPAQDAQKVSKPWDDPLFAAQAQAKLQRKSQKEAKAEAKKLAEEAKKDAELQQRELLELANPIPESTLNVKKDHGAVKGIQKLFHIHGGSNHSSNHSSAREGAVADVRESKLVLPKSGLFESSLSTTTTADAALAQIRSGPRPKAGSDIQFATVESNQRDVRPWTMEEYMARNARRTEWENRKKDEEFGGIEGNLLMNQYFDDDLAFDNFDSDSDDD